MNFDLSKSDYKAIENIGTGAYGVVCSAVQVKTGKKFAIKKIPNAFEEIITAKRTFRELKILRHFDHENVIRIHEILMPREALSEFKDVYVVMDLMESDLHQILHSNQPFTNEHTQYFLYQILRGLKYIHSANVVHRDLKPSNLLVNENCELKIGDFGMARGMSSKIDSHKKLFMTQYVATRWYRAPELLFSAFNYAQSVDMWSVGCIFAEMLARKQLFPGKNPVDQLMLIINVLGMPPDSMLESANSDQIVTFFKKRFGARKPIGLGNKVKPASPDALSLLSKMLAFVPEERISIMDALKDPFVINYHDPDDEPICLPKFDFSFDDQPMSTDQIRQQVGKMILKYSRQKMSSLKLPGGSAVSPKPMEPFDDLTPVSSASIGSGGKVQMQKALKDRETLIAEEIGSKVAEVPKSENVASFLKPATPPSLQPVGGTSPLKVTSGQVTTDVEMKSARSACNDAVNSILSITAKPQKGPGGKSDVEMKSAQRTDNDGTLEVPADVQMLSAKSEKGRNENVTKNKAKVPGNQLEESQVMKVVEKDKVSTEGAVVADHGAILKSQLGTGGEDMKALIKAALKNSVLMKSKLKKGQQDMHPRDQRPTRKMSLAQTRQKEREEKRRQRHKRAKEKQKKHKANSKESETEGSLLTTEDRNLLEKWKEMQTKDSQSRKVVRSNPSPGQSSSAVTQSQSTLTPVMNLNPTGGQPAAQGVILTLSNSSVVTNGNQNLIFVPVVTVPGNPVSTNSSAISQTVAVISDTSGNIGPSQTLTYTSQSVHSPSMLNISSRASNAPPLDSLSSFQDAPQPTITDDASASGFTDITSLLMDSPDPKSSPTQLTDDVFLGGAGKTMAGTPRGGYRSDAYHDTPSPPSFLSRSGSESYLPEHQGGPIKDAATPPDMNAISDHLARSAVLNDPFPYLQLTPRGDGSGYGLGVNLEDFLCDIPESDEEHGDVDPSKSSAEAQLSASVLSGILREHDLNPDDLQAIQQELGLTSPISLGNLSQLSPTTTTASASPECRN